MISTETRVGAFLRAIVHREAEALHAQSNLPAGYGPGAVFNVALAAFVYYLSERTGLTPSDFESAEGHDALEALVPIVFGESWWQHPKDGRVFAWHDLKLHGANRTAWDKLWKAVL